MKKKVKQYDYIICGGGCAGLSLAMNFVDPFFKNKKILVIDKDDKDTNDRTWCFWEENYVSDLYSDVISNVWEKVKICDKSRELSRSLTPLKYKRIQSIDFYNKAKRLISSASHIDWFKGEINSIDVRDEEVEISVEDKIFRTVLCFNSIPQKDQDPNEYFLKQHFLGWVVQFDNPILDSRIVDLMDFRIPQEEKEVRFVYVLPLNEKEAMIEVTIFSEALLEYPMDYERLLMDYISTNFKKEQFEITDKEFGIIPMSTTPYKGSIHSQIINIGNRSGRIKPSSGYAFKRIQEEIELIVNDIRSGNTPTTLNNQNRFLFYDKILFNVLLNNRMSGDDVFTTMFEKNEASLVLKFLEEKTHLFEEALIFSRLPVLPFLKALISEAFRRLSNK